MSYLIEKEEELLNLSEGEKVEFTGRIISHRDMKNYSFFDLYNINLEIQAFTDIKIKSIKIGDFIHVSGEIKKTQTGKKSIFFKEFKIIGISFRELPSRQGITNEDTEERFRFVNIIRNKEQREYILKHIKLINAVRNQLTKRGFEEVSTPILQPVASGAAAMPFKTYHEFLKCDVFLQIAPELYLKRYLIAGFPKVFSIASCFRNEGTDKTHLQEFKMTEFYVINMEYNNFMDFTIKLLQDIVFETMNSLKTSNIDFTEISKISYYDFLKKGGIDLMEINNYEKALDLAKKNNLDVSNAFDYISLIELLYKKLCVSKIINPVLVFNYPQVALAKPCNNEDFEKYPELLKCNLKFSRKFQIIFGGLEGFNCFDELTDPEIQRQNFEEQEKILKDLTEQLKSDENKKQVNDLVVRYDKSFVEALLYGMPQAAGAGFGINRLITVLLGAKSIQEVELFNLHKNIL